MNVVKLERPFLQHLLLIEIKVASFFTRLSLSQVLVLYVQLSQVQLLLLLKYSFHFDNGYLRFIIEIIVYFVAFEFF